jgi:hypothetical protein
VATLVAALKPDTAGAAYRNVARAVYLRWSKFGVAEALEEVGQDGRRGPQVEKLFATCRELNSPVEEKGGE